MRSLQANPRIWDALAKAPPSAHTLSLARSNPSRQRMVTLKFIREGIVAVGPNCECPTEFTFV
ncbi:MAG: hypothetical protein ACPG8Q_02395, partial [Candidatus Poseidoniaceae archaeon]